MVLFSLLTHKSSCLVQVNLCNWLQLTHLVKCLADQEKMSLLALFLGPVRCCHLADYSGLNLLCQQCPLEDNSENKQLCQRQMIIL